MSEDPDEFTKSLSASERTPAFAWKSAPDGLLIEVLVGLSRDALTFDDRGNQHRLSHSKPWNYHTGGPVATVQLPLVARGQCG